MSRAGPQRGWCAAGLVIGLATACAPPPPPSWQRPDVSPETARQVELDCHQRSIEAFNPGNNPEDAKAIHLQREDYFARCMRGSGFELR
ncbi:MAG: hypothetical protein WDO24_00505 [Pseudomonadota bacterium]